MCDCLRQMGRAPTSEFEIYQMQDPFPIFDPVEESVPVYNLPSSVPVTSYSPARMARLPHLDSEPEIHEDQMNKFYPVVAGIVILAYLFGRSK
jgi:hypothetical protein